MVAVTLDCDICICTRSIIPCDPACRALLWHHCWLDRQLLPCSKGTGTPSRSEPYARTSPLLVSMLNMSSLCCNTVTCVLYHRLVSYMCANSHICAAFTHAHSSAAVNIAIAFRLSMHCFTGLHVPRSASFGVCKICCIAVQACTPLALQSSHLLLSAANHDALPACMLHELYNWLNIEHKSRAVAASLLLTSSTV